MRWLRQLEATSMARKDVALPWVEWETVQWQGEAVARLDVVSLGHHLGACVLAL